MYATHHTVVIHLCGKHDYGKGQKKLLPEHKDHVVNPINVTLRSKVELGS